MNLWTRRKIRRQVRRLPWQAMLERLEDRTLLAAPVITTIPDQSVLLGVPFALNVTAGDFDHDPPDNPDPVTLTARLADGGLLPDWLVFVGGQGSFTGDFTAASGVFGSIDIVVTATDSSGNTDAEHFILTATDPSLTTVNPLVNQTVGVHTPFSYPAPALNVFLDTTNPADPITLSATLADENHSQLGSRSRLRPASLPARRWMLTSVRST